MQQLLSARQRTILIGILAFTLCVRLFTLGAYPLADTTEGRYAEIARKMAETGNWVTPQEDYGVPFWAKPPLSTWLTAISFKAFGVNEFTARLSSLLLVLAICWLTYYLSLRQRGRDHALMALFIAATTGLLFVTAGAVMTDASLGLSTTLCMVAFWKAYSGKGRAWGYLFFVGLAAGLLAKGAAAFVLTVFPLAIWTVWKRQWRTVWDRLPWVSGMLVTLTLAVPWYVLAELRTPGFLDYFFIGEHFNRFTVTGWRGDKYGTAHDAARGMIWLYWLLADLPWSLVFVGALVRKALRRKSGEAVLPTDDWTAYIISWAASPMLFFTLAGNIMLTYVLSGLPAFGILAAEVWRSGSGREDAPEEQRGRGVLWPAMGLVIPLIVLIMMSTIGPELVSRKSQKAVVTKYLSLRPNDASRLVYLNKRPHSAEFYTRGKAEQAKPEQLERYFENASQDFFVLRAIDLEGVPVAAMERLEPVWQYQNLNLMRERTDQP